MLKIVRPICCGIDVHKRFVVACLASTDEKGVTSYQTSRFSTFTNDLKSLASWLKDNNCRDVCMESTGKYWIPVFNILELSCNVVLAHPKYVKALRGKKTDKKDSAWIADLFKHDLVPGSFIPAAPIRQLRDLMRYRAKLTNATSSEKNRLQNSLTVSNIQLASVVSDVFGKSASALVEQLLISQKIDETIMTITAQFSEQLKLVSSVPGIGEASAIGVISEIGVDMSMFKTSKHLCSWAGLTPQNNESAGKKKSTRISKVGSFLKPLLVQCANAAVRSDKHPEIKRRYTAIKKRRGHKKAIIAICRMLLTAIYHILKKNEPYSPQLYKTSDIAPQGRTFNSIEEALVFLKTTLGCSIKNAEDTAP